ncbi:peptide deformylase [Gryllotalpicola sp.]|uniref:peptide deformylase n=1 Tax=Gryllotalpicola sp. TaxID=1932787 RepID=UPI0026224941|nr:peptide deformylase [Gryllotalpicola sp.]
MAVRALRLFGDPVLRTVSAPIEVLDAGIRSLVDDLVDTTTPPGRAGVAAPQIGVNLRAFSYNVDGAVGYLLNPRIVELGGEPELVGEGCLSLPGLWFETPRHPYAKALGVDLDGNEVELSGEGVFAQMLQHEVDHLDGHVYLDRLDKPTRREAMKAVRESSWF